MNKLFTYFLLMAAGITFGQDFSLEFTQRVEGDQLLVDLYIGSNDASSFELGSSNFPFKDEGGSLNMAGAIKVDSLDGIYSDAYDPDSYDRLSFNSGNGFYHVYLFRGPQNSGTGQTVDAEKRIIARVSVPITNPCGHSNLKWITSRGSINDFSSKRINKKADYINPGSFFFTDTLDYPTITNTGGLLTASGDDLSYQWYLNGVAIDGETGKNLSPTEAGDYTVEASNACYSKISNEHTHGLVTSTNPELNKDILISAFPNPYEERTTFSYTLEATSEVALDIVDAAGVHIVTLVDEAQSPGTYEYEFSAQKMGFAAGAYFAKMRFGDQVRVKKVVELSSK